MATKKVLTPGQCRAARGFLDWTQDELAARAGLSRSTVRDFEKGRHELHPSSELLLVRTLDEAGVMLIPPGDVGPGICLKRQT